MTKWCKTCKYWDFNRRSKSDRESNRVQSFRANACWRIGVREGSDSTDTHAMGEPSASTDALAFIPTCSVVGLRLQTMGSFGCEEWEKFKE